MRRKLNFQQIAWFKDIHDRKRLDLDPPYQRRSVWNQSYKDYFIDTILMEYPAPAIFLYEEITADGIATYHVVDGKQRLTTVFEFVSNAYPVGENSSRVDMRGKYFRDIDTDAKKQFWGYQFSVEYLPSTEEGVINNIFDRINKNMARLTAQELRHARFGGVFISAVEDITDWLRDTLPEKMPYIAERSRKQMKDVEFTAQLLLMLEEGAKGYSTSQLDEAFASRDAEWDESNNVTDRFRAAVTQLKSALNDTPSGQALMKSRLKNQADFYSIIGAIDSLLNARQIPSSSQISDNLLSFFQIVDDESRRPQNEDAVKYFEATRSASNDSGPRQDRIEIIKRILTTN